MVKAELGTVSVSGKEKKLQSFLCDQLNMYEWQEKKDSRQWFPKL